MKVKSENVGCSVMFVTLMDCSPPGSSVHEIWQARVMEGVPFPSLGHLPDPGIEPDLLHCRQNLYVLNHQGCPRWPIVSWLKNSGFFCIVIQFIINAGKMKQISGNTSHFICLAFDLSSLKDLK